MVGCEGGWLDGWLDVRVDGWLDVRVDGWLDVRVDGREEDEQQKQLKFKQHQQLFDLFPHLFPSGSVPLSSSPTSLSTPPTISLSSSRPISHAIPPTTTSTHPQASSSLSSLLLKIRRLSTSNHQLTTDDALMLKYETFLYDFILESNGGGDDNDGEGNDNDGEGNDGEDNDGGNDGGVDKGATYDASLHSQSRV